MLSVILDSKRKPLILTEIEEFTLLFFIDIAIMQPVKKVSFYYASF